MSFDPNISNENSWNLLYSVSAARSSTLTGAKIPIPVIKVPFLFQSHLIAISTDSDSAKGQWINEGWASFHVSTGIAIGGGNDGKVGESVRLFLNQRTIIQVPILSVSYGLEISVPPYFDDVTYVVHEYVGIGEPTIEDKLALIYEEITKEQT